MHQAGLILEVQKRTQSQPSVTSAQTLSVTHESEDFLSSRSGVNSSTREASASSESGTYSCPKWTLTSYWSLYKLAIFCSCRLVRLVNTESCMWHTRVEKSISPVYMTASCVQMTMLVLVPHQLFPRGHCQVLVTPRGNWRYRTIEENEQTFSWPGQS